MPIPEATVCYFMITGMMVLFSSMLLEALFLDLFLSPFFFFFLVQTTINMETSFKNKKYSK